MDFVNISKRIYQMVSAIETYNNGGLPDKAYEYSLILFGYLQGLSDGDVITKDTYRRYASLLPSWILTKFLGEN
jgi:hypothetical protein